MTEYSIEYKRRYQNPLQRVTYQVSTRQPAREIMVKVVRESIQNELQLLLVLGLASFPHLLCFSTFCGPSLVWGEEIPFFLCLASDILCFKKQKQKKRARENKTKTPKGTSYFQVFPNTTFCPLATQIHSQKSLL